MLFGRSFNIQLGLLALTAAFAMAQTTTTSGTVTRQTSTPPIGLASTETAQINVSNLATATSSGTAASCTGSISFVNASGTTIGTATSFTVTSGETSSVTLPYSKSGGSGARTEIRGIISQTETEGSGAAPCSLVSSLETYDSSSSVTHVYYVIGSESVQVAPAPFGR